MYACIHTRDPDFYCGWADGCAVVPEVVREVLTDLKISSIGQRHTKSGLSARDKNLARTSRLFQQNYREFGFPRLQVRKEICGISLTHE